MPLSRRQLLEALSGTTFFLTVASGTTASTLLGADETTAPQLPKVQFAQGVASADPQPASVMLWTRAEPEDGQSEVALQLQISDTEDFAEVRWANDLSTNVQSDFTVRAHISGLEPDRHYYYRFVAASGDTSRTGRTRTAPANDQATDLKLAFASCQSYEQAYFGAWARMLADDKAAPAGKQIDCVLHLGDFIYERSWHKRTDGSSQSRYVPPFPDGVEGERNRHAVSLADYRHLYKTYLSDPHLQEARARWPFICIWDDHEFSNDNFQSFSTYHEQVKLEAQRKLNANQAWFEFIPAALDELQNQTAQSFRPSSLSGEDQADNLTAIDSLRIYRQLRWGTLVDMVLTDTRSYRSEKCLPDELAPKLGLPMNTVKLVEMADAGRTYNNGSPPQTLPYGDNTLPNPGRDRNPGTCLGLSQRDWFLNTLKSSDATWKLWGNALPIFPMRLDLSSIPFGGYEDSIFTLDAWAGYPYEVSLMMKELHGAGVTGLVSLSGDHHMHGAGSVSHSASDSSAPAVMVDFAIAGISSTPMFEDLLDAAQHNPEFMPLVQAEIDGSDQPLWHTTLLQGSLASFAYARTGMAKLSQWLGPNRANPGLAFVDTTARGYGLAHFTASELTVDMVTVEPPLQPFTEPPKVLYRARFQLPHWQPGAAPELAGPVFEGLPPFPFVPEAV
jgi:alkaline phosphatase D